MIGCENITTGAEDKALCEALRSCMITQACAAIDPFDCYCGPSTGAACLTTPRGLCLQQALNAAKTSDVTEGGTRFYDLAYPSGFATQDIACRREFCGPTAEPPYTNACPLTP